VCFPNPTTASSNSRVFSPQDSSSHSSHASPDFRFRLAFEFVSQARQALAHFRVVLHFSVHHHGDVVCFRCPDRLPPAGQSMISSGPIPIASLCSRASFYPEKSRFRSVPPRCPHRGPSRASCCPASRAPRAQRDAANSATLIVLSPSRRQMLAPARATFSRKGIGPIFRFGRAYQASVHSRPPEKTEPADEQAPHKNDSRSSSRLQSLLHPSPITVFQHPRAGVTLHGSFAMRTCSNFRVL